MRHLNKFLCLAAILLGISWASAETVTNYTVDFNTTINTSDHAFRVAPGWKHIVGTGESSWGGTSYMSYSYYSTSGVDGTGALYCGAQQTNLDYLVTPAITGSFTIQVKLSYGGTIQFYAIAEDNEGNLTPGDLLLEKAYSSDEGAVFAELALSDLNAQRVGIVAKYAYLDDFAVTGTAEVEYVPGLTVTDVVSSVPNSGTLLCDEDNNYSFTYTITVQNTGEMDIPADYENFTVGVIQYDVPDVVLGATPIGQALAIGESATVEVTVNMNYANYPGRKRYDAIENISGTTKVVTPWIEVKPYLPEIDVRDANNYSMDGSYGTKFADFGMTTVDVTKTMRVRNNGAAPGNVTITVPEGFSAEPATFTVDAGATTEVAVTLLAAETGVKSGDMVVACEGVDATFTLTLTGTVLDPNKFFEPFTDNASSTDIPAGWYAPTGNWSKTNNTNGDNNYAKCALLAANKLITPLLKVTEGEKMTFEASKQSSSNEQFVNVYYSTDRENWTLVKEVAAADMQGSYGNVAFTTFVIEGVPAGNYYIAFESGYCLIDNVYGFELVPVDYDVVVNKFEIPGTAMANNDLTAKVTLQNLLGEAVPAEYAPALYFDGVKVAEAEAVEIPANGTATVEFVFVPNEVGTFPAKAEFVFSEDYTVATSEVEVEVAAEQGNNVIVVGNTDPNASGWNISNQSYAVPICNYYKNSSSEALYTPAMLEEAGMTQGDVITSITYMGYSPGEVTDAIKVYVIPTEAETMATFEKTDVTGLTPVFDSEYTFTAVGSATAPVDLFSVTLPEPITWDGKSLRIVVLSDRVTGGDVRSCFLTDTSLGGEIYQFRSDGVASSAFTTSNFTSVTYFPVTKFTVEAEPITYSGVVNDTDGNPIEGVTVTLTSQAQRGATAGSAVYTATTDAEGKFEVNVVQNDKTYKANFAKDGYKDVNVEGLDFANGSIALDEPVVMELDDVTGVNGVNAGKTVASVKYYNVAGQAADKAFQGVNIVVTTYTDGTTSTVKVIK